MRAISILSGLMLLTAFAGPVNAFTINLKNNTDEHVVLSPTGMVAGVSTGPMMRGEMGKGIQGGVLHPAVVSGEGTSIVTVNRAGQLNVRDKASDREKIKAQPGGSLQLRFNHLWDKLVCFDPKGFDIYTKNQAGEWNKKQALLYKVETGSQEARKLSTALEPLGEIAAATSAVAKALPAAIKFFEDPACGDQRYTLIELDDFNEDDKRDLRDAGLIGRFALLKF